MTPLPSHLGDRQSNDDEGFPLVLEDITVPDSLKDSNTVSRNLLAWDYKNPEAGFILKKVRMDGIDAKFRRCLVSKGTGKAVSQEANNDMLAKYSVLLNKTMDRMHTIEHAALSWPTCFHSSNSRSRSSSFIGANGGSKI